MGKWALVFVGIVLFAFIFIWITESLLVIQHLAIVDTVTGKATVTRHDTSQAVALKSGTITRAGDVITTDGDSSVELRWARWAGGMRLRIGPNSRFKVIRAIMNASTKDEESRLRLDFGQIWIRLRKALTGKSKFEVETPTVVATIRGTILSVAVAKDGTSEVEVLEGKVGVSPKQGEQQSVSAGNALEVAENRPMTSLRPLTQEELAEWQQHASMVGPFLEVHAPADNSEIPGDTCTVAGRAEPGSILSVNGQQIPLSKDGTFSVDLPISEITADIQISARDPQGRETVIKRVLRSPQPVQ